MKPRRFRKTSESAIAARLPAVRSAAILAIPSLAIPATRFAAIRVRRLVAAIAAAVATSVVSAVAVVAALVAFRIPAARRVIRAAARRVTRAAATRAGSDADVAAVASAVGAGVVPLAFRILTVGTAAGAPIPLAAPIAVGILTTLGIRPAVAVAIDASSDRSERFALKRLGLERCAPY